MWKWKKHSEHLYLQIFNKRNNRGVKHLRLSFRNVCLKLFCFLLVTQKRAMWSLKVNSREIQIVGDFSQDSGEAGLCYQQPPTPGSVVKNLPASAGESPGEGNSNSLQSAGSPKGQMPLSDEITTTSLHPQPSTPPLGFSFWTDLILRAGMVNR